MADVGERNYVIPYVTPEPRCVPGYTGYLPGYGPKRIYQMAQTYGHMTHDLMTKHPISGQRLENMTDTKDIVQGEKNREVWNDEDMSQMKRSQDIIPGYTGHIPRKMFQIGKNSIGENQDAEDEYEQYRKKKSDIAYSYPQQNIFPSKPPGHGVRPYELTRAQQIPFYADYRNPMNYDSSPFCKDVMDEEERYSSSAHGTSYPVKNGDMNVDQRRQSYLIQQNLLGRGKIEPLLPQRSCCCKCHEHR